MSDKTMINGVDIGAIWEATKAFMPVDVLADIMTAEQQKTAFQAKLATLTEVSVPATPAAGSAFVVNPLYRF